MNKFNWEISPLIYGSLLISFTGLVFSYLIAYSWLDNDGYSLNEVSMLAILPAIVFFIVTIVIFSYSIIKYRETKVEKIILKWYYLAPIGLISIIAFSLILDYFYFYIIDNTISAEFAKTFMEFLETNNKDISGAEEIADFPFFVQNIGAIIFFLLLGILLSLPIAKSLSKPKSQLR